MTIQVSATFEYSGLPDYWSGNGQRWAGDHACVFAFYGPTTTLRELIDEMARDDCDQDGKPLFDRVTDDQIHAALIEMLTPLGVAGLNEIAICAREYGDANGHDYTLSDDDAARDCACCDLDAGHDTPQIICMLALTCDACERDASECDCDAPEEAQSAPEEAQSAPEARPCYECAERVNAGRERCPVCPYAPPAPDLTQAVDVYLSDAIGPNWRELDQAVPSAAELDETPRYAPDHVLIVGVGTVPVIRYVIHPAQSDAERRMARIPILGAFVALECVTQHGSRFWGVRDAWINSELRACVSGYSARDEIGPKRWAVAPKKD